MKEDNFIFIMNKMIKVQEKLIKKAFDAQNWGRLAELEAYKSGLEQGLINYEVVKQ